ncbi:hypothetical protein TcCL_Unassigned01155, partial [Trypanosoma cruzi]
GSFLPVVPWDGEERACGAGRSHWRLLKKDCEGHPSLLRRALIPAAAPTQRMSTRLLTRRIRRLMRGSRSRCSDRQRGDLAQRHRGYAAGGFEEERSSVQRRCRRRWCDVCCGTTSRR